MLSVGFQFVTVCSLYAYTFHAQSYTRKFAVAWSRVIFKLTERYFQRSYTYRGLCCTRMCLRNWAWIAVRAALFSCRFKYLRGGPPWPVNLAGTWYFAVVGRQGGGGEWGRFAYDPALFLMDGTFKGTVAWNGFFDHATALFGVELLSLMKIFFIC